MIYETFIKTVNRMRPLHLFVCGIIDILFIIYYSIFSSLGYKALVPRLSEIGDQMAKNFTANQEMLSVVNEIVLVLLLYFFLVYLGFAVFQGINWFFSHRLLRKLSFWGFMKRFTLTSFVYFLIFLVVAFLSLRSSFNSAFMNEGKMAVYFFISLFIVAYFALISFSFDRKVFRNTMRTAKKVHLVLLSYLVVFVLFLALNLLLNGLGALGLSIYSIGGIIVSAVLILPAITFSRVFLVSVLRRIGNS
ncbi:MAG: hypothetical protein ACQEP1_04985 [Nanobdellota archaeon]